MCKRVASLELVELLKRDEAAHGLLPKQARYIKRDDRAEQYTEVRQNKSFLPAEERNTHEVERQAGERRHDDRRGSQEYKKKRRYERKLCVYVREPCFHARSVAERPLKNQRNQNYLKINLD